MNIRSLPETFLEENNTRWTSTVDVGADKAQFFVDHYICIY